MRVTRLLLVLILLFSVSCNRTDKEKTEDKEINKKIQILKQAVSDMAEKHNAITDWEKNLDKHSLYTIQVEDVLIRSDNRPILFFGRVDDITKKANKYFLHFKKMLSPWIYFVLECNEEQVENILHNKDSTFYAVAARISSIQRPEFEFEHYHAFIANGLCIDLLPAKYYLPSPTPPPEPGVKFKPPPPEEEIGFVFDPSVFGPAEGIARKIWPGNWGGGKK